MRLRFTNKVVVKFEVPNKIPDIEIPPMLFVSLLENAFKHGVSYQSHSYITFSMFIVEQKIICILKNSKHKNTAITDKKYSGIGLSNIKKSLDLLFQKDYNLVINDSESDFEVQLTIPMYEDKMFSH
jgi:LytS/YehU family sensor histidine kinase